MPVDQDLKQQLEAGLISAAEFVHAHLPSEVKIAISIQQIESVLTAMCEVAYAACPYVLNKQPPQS